MPDETNLPVNDELNEPENLVLAAPLLPLDVPRVVALKSKNNIFRLRFRRITLDDWEKYFTGIVNQTLNVNGTRETVFESETAQLDLVDRTLVSAEGYGDLTGVKEWKLAIPLYHRIAAGISLRSVGVAKSSSAEPVLCDLTEVRLDANWSAAEGDKMMQFTGLVHRFRHPTPAQLKRFNFESARVRVSGDAENGVSTHPARQAISMKIYDELIESVEGYVVGENPLSDVETIKREMDGAHKAEAALALFLPDERIDLL